MFDRREDKEVRRVSKKAKLDPMIDEDSSDGEGYDFPLGDIMKPSRTSPAKQTRRSRTPDVHPEVEDTEATSVPATAGRTASVTAAPASVGSALLKNADGRAATPRVLPKRNKGSKVDKTPILPRYRLNVVPFVAPKLEAKSDPSWGRIRGFFRQLGFGVRFLE